MLEGNEVAKTEPKKDYPLNGSHSHHPILLLYGYYFRCWQAVKQGGVGGCMCCFIVSHVSAVAQCVTVTISLCLGLISLVYIVAVQLRY